jgi:putative transposase
VYHIVFIPKYRRKVMFGKLKIEIREIIRKLCDYRNVEIVEGAVCSDHIHLCLKIPPKLSISEFMGYLKGKSALMIFDLHPEFRTRGDRHFWASGYYVDTVGQNELTIVDYIKNQYRRDKSEDRLI